jgi:hypothetical protein
MNAPYFIFGRKNMFSLRIYLIDFCFTWTWNHGHTIKSNWQYIFVRIAGIDFRQCGNGNL